MRQIDTSQDRFGGLQILRFIAALAVILYHSRGAAQDYLGQTSAIFAPFVYGSYGVDLFFVISGFIIYHVVSRRENDARSFLWRRITRIVPLYWCLTVVAVIAALLFPTMLRSNEDYSLGALLHSLFFVSFVTRELPILYVGWTLEFEMFFYLATALFLLGTASPWAKLIATMSALVIVGLFFPWSIQLRCF
jgi:exopolysaccharide production protein ExoZ